MSLTKIFVLITATFVSSHAYSGKVDISPIISSSYTENGLNVIYRLPCGARFQGIAVSPSDTNIEMGVVYTKGVTHCMTLKPTEETTLAWLPRVDGRKILPMLSTKDTLRWKERNISEISILNAYKQKDLRVIYTSKCGNKPFLMIHQSGPQGLTVSAYEKLTSQSRSHKCQYKEKSVLLKKIVDYTKPMKITKLRTLDSDIEKQFSLRIAKTVHQSIRRPFSGGLSLRYHRKCNEAPIGLITTKIKTTSKNKEIKVVGVGILVAHFYNQKCKTSTSKKSIVTYKHPNINIPNTVLAKRLKPGSWNNSLMVRSPAISKSIKNNKFNGLIIDYYSACNRQVGALYGVDTYGNTSVGIIEKVTTDSCKKSLKRVSLYQPFFKAYSLTEEDKFYPLRIRGA